MASASYGLRHPASALCLGRHLRLAGRCPNNSSLFPPLAAVVVVAGHVQRKRYFYFGIEKRLRTLRYPIFTGGVVKANGIYHAASGESAFQIIPRKRNGSAAVPFCCPTGGIVLYWYKTKLGERGIKSMKIPANGFTHAGKFHADDVFATALLQILRPDIKITRGFTVPDDFDGIVYDIGFGMFDHHQEPREYRANGVPYAAFGLLWRVLGPGLVGERQARLIDENFIQPLDLNDNTGEQNSLCDAIGFFNPVWDSKEDQDSCFFKAVAVAKQILENQIDSANAVNRADEKVQQAYRNSRDGIVVLPCYLPWKNGLYKTDALFVVYPSQRGGWSAQCVTDHKTKKSKLPFPQSWAGQPQEVIEQKSGIPGISFCHASRFLITAKDKETALAACRQVLKNNGRLD